MITKLLHPKLYKKVKNLFWILEEANDKYTKFENSTQQCHTISTLFDKVDIKNKKYIINKLQENKNKGYRLCLLKLEGGYVLLNFVDLQALDFTNEDIIYLEYENVLIRNKENEFLTHTIDLKKWLFVYSFISIKEIRKHVIPITSLIISLISLIISIIKPAN